jgi:alpha-1,4-galacturonosyltransferase
MLGLGYNVKSSLESTKEAAVIHYNGQAKPWLDVAFPHLRPLWSKYVNYSNEFIRQCNILDRP